MIWQTFVKSGFFHLNFCSVYWRKTYKQNDEMLNQTRRQKNDNQFKLKKKMHTQRLSVWFHIQIINVCDVRRISLEQISCPSNTQLTLWYFKRKKEKFDSHGVCSRTVTSVVYWWLVWNAYLVRFDRITITAILISSNFRAHSQKLHLNSKA